jgi:hypothetical protein
LATTPRLERLNDRYRGHQGRRDEAGRDPDPDPTHLQMFSPESLVRLLGQFADVRVRFAVGRFVRYHPRLMARVMVFTGRRDEAAEDEAPHRARAAASD